MNNQTKQMKISMYFNFTSAPFHTFKQKSEISRECYRFHIHSVSS